MHKVDWSWLVVCPIEKSPDSLSTKDRIPSDFLVLSSKAVGTK